MKEKIHSKTEQGAIKNPLLSRAEVAGYFGVCPHTIQRWERAGLLKSVRLNRRVLRYRDEDVQRLVADAGDFPSVQPGNGKGGSQ